MNASSKRKIFKNLSWLSGEHVCRTLIALPVSILVARYLGPENVGILGYAAALVGIFLPLTAPGLAGIVVRDLVRGVGKTNETLGSAFALQLIGSVLVTIVATIAVFFLRPGQPIIQLAVVIAAAGHLFTAFQVIDYWFQYKVVSHSVVVGRVIAMVVVVAIKLGLLWYQASLIPFAIATAVESILVAGFLCYAYRSANQSLLDWKSTFDRGRELLAESWPLTATGFAIVIQAYIDQVMLGQMLGNESVGQYSIAIRLIGAVTFLPVVMQRSWAPSVTEAKTIGPAAYDRRMSQLYQLMFGIFLLQGIPIFYLAQPLVTYLYGIQFAEAGALLALLAIRLLFSNYGLARSVYIANESLFRHAMVTAVAGSVVNVVANYLLIPGYGAHGAIIATIISFTVTTFAIDAFAPATRNNFRLMINSPFAATSTALRFLTARAGV